MAMLVSMNENKGNNLVIHLRSSSTLAEKPPVVTCQEIIKRAIDAPTALGSS